MGKDKVQQPPLSHTMRKSSVSPSISACAHPSSIWYAHLSAAIIEDPAIIYSANHEREYIEHSKIADMINSSISRRNFAKKLVAMIFTKAEQSMCNENGRNKPRLDPIRINYVKKDF